jgi:hypothetical protein
MAIILENAIAGVAATATTPATKETTFKLGNSFLA